jgi:hypothetical protein
LMDAFEELGLERDLRVSEEVLRERYDRGSKERHPDGGGTREGFAQLREAYEMLRSPARRLRHWLELEGEQVSRIGMVPEELMGLFGEVGGLLQRVEGVRVKKEGARTALVRSMVECEVMELAEGVEAMRGRVAERAAELEGCFGGFQERGLEGCVEEAMTVAASLAFLEKWEAQLREAWVGLAL